MRKVPELSLSDYTQGDKQEFSRKLYDGLVDYGFIILKNHSVPESLLNQAYELSEQLFNLPLNTKKSYTSSAHGGQRGYTPFGVEHAKDAEVMDLKEFWHVGRLNPQSLPQYDYPENIWPNEMPEFKEVFSKIYTELEVAAQIILEALTFPLDLDKDYFRDRISNGNSILRLLHYPPIPENADPRCLRAAPHEDINLITLLVSATASGLQLKDRDGSWLDIETDPNNIIVDSGDMLSRITNDVIPATTHQVVNPSDKRESRYSMTFFVHPNPDAMLSCLPSCKGEGAKYEDILSHDFLMERLREIGLVSAEK